MLNAHTLAISKCIRIMKIRRVIRMVIRNFQTTISGHQAYGLMLGLSLLNPLNYIPIHRVTLTSPGVVPTIYKNQAVWFNVLPNKWGKIELGTVIWFETPKSQGNSLISRVVGLPGDTVELKSGLVYQREKCRQPQNS